MKKSLHTHGVILGLVLACLLLPLRPAVADDLSYFDWRNIDGKDYTTPIRSQSVDGSYYAGTCWAFAAVAALEARLEICYDLPDWDPDLSEQHLVCSGKCGSAAGGWEDRALQYIEDYGIVTEEELPYTATNNSPYWPLDEDWLDRAYTITGFTKVTDFSTDNVKLMLRTYGPLTSAVHSGTSWDDSDWIRTPASAPVIDSPAGDAPTGSSNHIICVIGYKDDVTILNGGYWIIKNSWGVGYGDDGYFYVPYGVMEAHERIYAVTGDAVAPVPEPASMILLSAGFILVVRKRKTISI